MKSMSASSVSDVSCRIGRFRFVHSFMLSSIFLAVPSSLALEQRSATRGPRVICGPRSYFMRPGNMPAVELSDGPRRQYGYIK